MKPSLLRVKASELFVLSYFNHPSPLSLPEDGRIDCDDEPIHPFSPPVNAVTPGYPAPKGQPQTQSNHLTPPASENEVRG
jgi:hypothetical protein